MADGVCMVSGSLFMMDCTRRCRSFCLRVASLTSLRASMMLLTSCVRLTTCNASDARVTNFVATWWTGDAFLALVSYNSKAVQKPCCKLDAASDTGQCSEQSAVSPHLGVQLMHGTL
jgi:hypothetical protein